MGQRKTDSPFIKMTDALRKRVRRVQSRHQGLGNFKKTVKNFRPRKSERQSFVFVRTDGSRTTRRDVQGYLLYVYGSKGRTRYRRVEELMGKKSVNTHLLGDYKVATFKRKRAIRKFFAVKVRPETDRRTGKPVLLKYQGKDVITALEKILRQLKIRGKKFGSRVTFQGTLTFQFKERIDLIEYQYLYQAGVNEDFVNTNYAALAELLAFDGLVTRGSWSYVRDLNENDGKEEDEWKKRGMEWNKNHFEKVNLNRASATIGVVRKA